MTIIAKQSDNRWLIHIRDRMARVADLAQGIVFPEQNIDSIVKFGYWQDAEHDPRIMEQINALEWRDAECQRP